MRTRIALLALVLLTLPQGGVAAQEGGMGGFLDWLHKLSGPQFLGFGATWYQGFSEDNALRIRASAAFRTSVDETEEVDPDDANITMFTVSPTLEYPLGFANVEAAAGISVNFIGGDSDGFVHFSFPLLLQWRPPLGASGLILRVGAGTTIFPSFGVDDFEPLVVDVSRDGAEAVLRLVFGLEWERGSWFN